ncbi:hypothetical protein SK803_43300 [Lentzea sp. BCCO 10_0856]|uniref:Uncharacterized protein n=1 Tax=Lentzea miocenica TaxID=3095431 RepID=A0ABU4TG89_9PSEU|nr:hypothetical protein [Lentzea sp. BCCO 10_0856]MDX8037060.1 hypothetical protein [Lentzea sp. BCCO 10_0856]
MALLVPGIGVAAAEHGGTPSSVHTVRSEARASDGTTHTITNHLTEAARHGDRGEWLLVWAGDAAPGENGPDPDFLAVVGATKGSPSYGKVVNTVTLDQTFANEPHHMQYTWHKGDKVYAGGLFSDIVYVFDVAKLPVVTLSGITLAADTPCGSAPDAFSVLKDGTAYVSYMGGPDVAGPCRYTNGEVRDGNGFAGSPGEVVHIDAQGRVLREIPAALPTPEAATCHNVPALPQPTCANPHGIGVREDLGRMVSADVFEARNLLTGSPPPDGLIARDTVRFFDISDRSAPRLTSVTHLPDGPRPEPDARSDEPFAVMEVALTNQARHRGAFASTMNGAVYYTPDITAAQPVWREVFDDGTAFKSLFPQNTPTSGSDAGAWLAVSPDDRFLYHVVMKGGWNSPPGAAETGMLYVLDIKALLASGAAPQCSIDEPAEVTGGGREADCPRLADAEPMADSTSGGPHWAAMDNFTRGRDGHFRETTRISRIATSNYFVAPTGFDGDHKVCMTNVSPKGELTPDPSFRDDLGGRGCIDFDRTRWPHGERGGARPHGVLFAVADADLH